jgi:hypothetical protein
MTPEELLAELHGEAPPKPTVSQNAPNVQNQPNQADSNDEPFLNQDINRIRDDVSKYADLESMSRQADSENHGFFKDVAPTIVENAVPMAIGNLSGRILQKAIPKEYQYNPDLADVREKQLPKAYEELGNIHEESMNDLDKRQAEREAHINQGQILEHEARLKHNQLRNTENQLAQARDQQLGAHTLEPEHFMSTQYPIAEDTKPTTATLTEKPIGGSGTASYAEKFGATPEEASRVPSMSVMQKQNIPSIASSMERINALEPNVRLTAESPLLLTPEAQKIVEERKLAQLQQEYENQANEIQRKAEHQMAVKQVAHAKFQADQEVKRLERLRDQHEREHRDAIEEHKKHMASLPQEPELTKSQKKELQQKSDLIDELKNKTNRQYGTALARFGSKIAPRFIPDIGATFAPLEAESALENYRKGNYGHALLHGAGALGAALQATNVPPLMGIGDILQAPAAGVATGEFLWDLMKNKPTE